MAVAPETSEHVPAWKRLGLKLKNSQAVDPTAGPLAVDTATAVEKSKKRKAKDISGDAKVSHDEPKAAASQLSKKKKDDPSLKRTKSVAFADGTKVEDGDSNEKLLEDFVAEQNGGDGQFTKSEVAQFTAPSKVHPANEPATKVNGTDETKSKDDKRAKKEKKKERKHQDNASAEPLQDQSYVTYLKEYHTSRATWKFNKVQQTKLIANLYNTYRIPFEVDAALSSYLSGLHGEGPRKRLADEAQKLVDETQDLEGANDMANLQDARQKALKAQLKQTKSNLRNKEAAEHAYSDEHQEKLRKRKRALLILQSLKAFQASSSDPVVAHVKEDLGVGGPPEKRKKARRSRNTRTSVPDDDDTDETSSVSSVPESATSAGEGEEDGDEDSGSGSDGSSGSENESSDESSSDDSSDSDDSD